MKDKVIDQARCTMQKYNMVVSGDSVLVALSGGPDSVCLLDVLVRLQDDFEIEVLAVHVDHELRDESSDEASKVQMMCQARGIFCAIERIAVQERSTQFGESIQEAARTLRYDALQRAAKSMGANRIAVGHTADDQAETVLMRMIRGAGSTGLSGIPPVRSNIIRPLIGVWRSETIAYCKHLDLPYLLDPSNVSNKYMRNRVRNHLIPLLEADYNPRLREALCRLAELLQADEEYFDRQVRAAFNSPELAGESGPGWVRVRARGLEKVPIGLARRVLRYAYRMATGAMAPTFDRLEAALQLRQTGTRGGAVIELGGHAHAVRNGPWLEIRHQPGSDSSN